MGNFFESRFAPGLALLSLLVAAGFSVKNCERVPVRDKSELVTLVERDICDSGPSSCVCDWERVYEDLGLPVQSYSDGLTKEQLSTYLQKYTGSLIY